MVDFSGQCHFVNGFKSSLFFHVTRKQLNLLPNENKFGFQDSVFSIKQAILLSAFVFINAISDEIGCI